MRPLFFRPFLRGMSLGLFLALFVPFSYGQEVLPAEGTIATIEVVGAKRVGADSVKLHSGLKVGDSFSPDNLNQALKRLYDTDFYEDIRFQRKDDTLVVYLVENPVINRVSFEGNRRVKDEQLTAELPAFPRSVYTRTKVRRATDRILQLYRYSGRFTASVEPKIIKLSDNRVDLVFEIEEGPLTKIRSIQFIGNRAFSDSTLKDEIFSKEEKVWNFLTSADRYDPGRMDMDRDNLYNFYLQGGYLEFQVESLIAELDDEEDSFIVTFTVSEGKRYRYGKITLGTDLKDIPQRQLEEKLTSLQPGDWYNSRAVDRVQESLEKFLGSYGYAFVKVEVIPDIRRKDKRVDMRFQIDPSPKSFVEEINIHGNTRTIDEVVRREFRFVEGDPYDASKLARSRSRLNNLDFFSRVNIEVQPGTEPDQVIVDTQVEEKPTGNLYFGGGYDSDKGVVVGLTLQERNFLGRGWSLSSSFRFYTKGSSDFSVSFYEPYFLDREVSTGVKVYYSTTELSKTYSEKDTGVSFELGFRHTEELSQSLFYGLGKTKPKGKASAVSKILEAELKGYTKSYVGTMLTYDTRDSLRLPRSGHLVQAEFELAGLGGSVNYFKNVMRAAKHTTLSEDFSEDLILSFEGEAGQIFGFGGKKTRVSDRFFLGGSDMRGFKLYGITPREAKNKEPLGGRHYYRFRTELSFPTALPKEYNVRGNVFLDAGSVWKLDVPKKLQHLEILDSSKPRASVGVGIAWDSPMGLLTINIAAPLAKKTYDKTRRVNIGFGTSF